MEPNHFSHNHGLVFHHLPQGSQVHCSGCKSPASGDVYACRQCNHFLHQQCFLAPRSLNHPPHPLHPLTLMAVPTYPSSSFICDSCQVIGNGLSYTCSQCDFDLHVHCSHTPNATTPSLPCAEAGGIEEELSRLLGQKVSFDSLLQMMRPKAEEERVNEAYVKKMEMEEELRRRRQDMEMQRLQYFSDGIDRMGRIG